MVIKQILLVLVMTTVCSYVYGQKMSYTIEGAIGKNKYGFYQDNHNNFFVHTTNGIYTLKGNTLLPFGKELDGTLSSQNVRAMNMDSSGAYWFGFANNSLQKTYGSKLINFIAVTPDQQLLVKGSTNQIVHWQNHVLIASDYGVFELDEQMQVLKRFSFSTHYPKVLHSFNTTDLVRCMIQDKRNKKSFWIGGTMGLAHLDISSGDWEHYPMPQEMMDEPLSPKFNYQNYHNLMVTDVAIMNNKIYCATWGNGIMMYDVEKNEWKKYPFQAYTSDVPLDENIVAQLVFLNDSIIVATTQACKSPVVFNILQERYIDFEEYFAVPPAYDYSDAIALIGEELCIGYNNSLEVYKVKHSSRTGISLVDIGSIAYIKSGDSVLWLRNMNISSSEVPFLKVNEEKLLVQFQKPIGAFGSFEYVMDDPSIEMQRGFSLEMDDLKKGNHTIYYRLEGQEKWETINVFKIPKWYENIWLWLISMLLGFISFGFLYNIYTRRKQDRKTKQLELQNTLLRLERQALQAQINPHFIFNCLVSIKSIIIHEDKKAATDFINDFAKYIRQVLNVVQQDSISLEDELELVNKYVSLEVKRFDTPFDFDIIVEEGVDISKIKIPPLILQPFVENSIWHGIIPNDKKGEIKIFITHTAARITIKIEDNGAGIQKDKQNEKAYSSQGAKITEKRLRSFYGDNLTFSIDNRLDDKGVRVHIAFDQ